MFYVVVENNFGKSLISLLFAGIYPKSKYLTALLCSIINNTQLLSDFQSPIYLYMVMNEKGFMTDSMIDDELKFDDDSDEEIIEEEESDFQEITSYTVGNSVRTIVDMIENDIIDLKPEFQRDFVWDIRRASKLIDSLLCNLPIPNTLLGKYKKTEKFIVIDGQQRLKSIYFFLKEEFRENQENKSFKLRGLEDKSWNGKLYSELDEVLQRKIQNSIINSTILDNVDSNPRIVFEIFNRLNTGGVPLTNQEVRNCIFSGEFNVQLKELNLCEPWRKIYGNQNPNKRMNDIELILRFFSLYNEKYKEYKAPMREWLNNEMKRNLEGLDDYDDFYCLFENTARKIYSEFGEDVFKIKGRNFNRSVFDAIMVSIASGIINCNFKDDLKEKYGTLLVDPNFQNCMTEGTTDSKKVKGRIDLAMEYFLD
ncbi:MAG: DUF262 domain-containing protein [Thermotogota bacterium]|nr:DUF262 domain-containing protein [Thermotogota bacterium]